MPVGHLHRAGLFGAGQQVVEDPLEGEAFGADLLPARLTLDDVAFLLEDAHVVEVLLDVLEPDMQQLAELGLGRLRRREDGVGALEQRVHQLVADQDEQLVARVDVVIEAAGGQAGRLEQRRDGRGVVATLGEHVGGGIDDRTPTELVASAERWAGGRGEHRGPVASEERCSGFPNVCSVYSQVVDFDLSDAHALVQRTVRDFAQARVAPVAGELDRTHSFPYEIVRELGELGLMGIPFPEEYGGGGADTLAYVLAIEELARVDSSVAITVCAHISLGTQPIFMFGTERQKQEWLPQLCSGERLGAFGLTEPEAGSDAGNTKTRAALEDGEWVIDGAKQFITNAGTDISGVVCITALTGEGEISNLIVANGTPGYEQDEPYRKMGWNASDTRGLRFSGCRVPDENLLGVRGAGLRQFLKVLDGGRIGVAAMGVGLAQGALDQALAYAQQRHAFGQPISKFQAIQGKLADMSCEIEAARLLVYRAASEKDLGRNFSLTAAQAKLKTGRLAVRCAEEAVQIHGGYGYIEEYPVCRFYRDAKILTIGEGTDEIQQMVIAKALGA